MKFRGFEDWIEIFRGGKQVDSRGIERDGDALIDKAVADFNPKFHEPPAVVGHPKTDDPAFGWIEAVKAEVKDGVKVLLARFRDVVPEFAEMVEKGLFRKRSAAFYPDGTLRHVGFLGAAPPAVKGLADLKFENAGDMIAFEEPLTITNIEDNMDKLEELRASLDARHKADLAAAVETAKKQARAEAAAEFAEREAETKRASEFLGFLNELDLPPALKAGWPEFAASLDHEVIEFSEGGKKTPIDFVKAHLENLQKFGPLFSEMATKDAATKKPGETATYDPNLTSKL